MQILGDIPKNKREKILVSTDDYRDHAVCTIRVYFNAEADTWLPTRKGITFASSFLPEIIQALKAASESLEVPHEKA